MQKEFLDINRILLIKKIYEKNMSENSELCSSFAVFAEILLNNEIKSQQELSALAHCNKAHTSRTLLKMQLRGLVKVGKSIILTEKGVEYAKNAVKCKENLLEKMFEGVTDAEKQTFAKVLDKLIENSKRNQ